MNRSLSYAVAALVLAALPACGSSLTTVEEHRLDGSWEWVRATGGIAGVEITPQSEGYDLELRIDADATVELFRDGELQVRTTFSIQPVEIGPESPGDYRIVYAEPVFGGWDEQYLVQADGAVLVLADPCCDGFTWEFVAAD